METFPEFAAYLDGACNQGKYWYKYKYKYDQYYFASLTHHNYAF